MKKLLNLSMSSMVGVACRQNRQCVGFAVAVDAENKPTHHAVIIPAEKLTPDLVAMLSPMILEISEDDLSGA